METYWVPDFPNIKSISGHPQRPISIAELRRPGGPPSGAPYSYREIKETHELISRYRGQRHFSWARTQDDVGGNGGVAQHGGHTPSDKLTEVCSLGLQCTFLIYDIMLLPIGTCPIKLSADQYHKNLSRARIYCSSRSRVLLKLTPYQVLGLIGLRLM